MVASANCGHWSLLSADKPDARCYRLGAVLINRRTFLFAASASTLAACTSRTRLAGGADAAPAGNSNSKPNPDPKKLPASIAMVGDSITARSQTALQRVLTQVGFSSITINAEPSRRIEAGTKKPTPGIELIKFIAASDTPGMWVIALGTNDAGLYANDSDYQSLIDKALKLIADKTPLVWMNAYRHDQLKGCEQFNSVLRNTLKRRGNATVGEWYQQCTDTKEAILTNDGVHPNDAGILVFADTIRAAIATRLT